MSPTDPTNNKLAQEMTKFLGDPSEVLNPATEDPEWAKDPLKTLDKHLAAHGYSEEARRQICEGAKHMDAMSTELLSTLGL